MSFLEGSPSGPTAKMRRCLIRFGVDPDDLDTMTYLQASNRISKEIDEAREPQAHSFPEQPMYYGDPLEEDDVWDMFTAEDLQG